VQKFTIHLAVPEISHSWSKLRYPIWLPCIVRIIALGLAGATSGATMVELSTMSLYPVIVRLYCDVFSAVALLNLT
jgi:hypothetical protein